MASNIRYSLHKKVLKILKQNNISNKTNIYQLFLQYDKNTGNYSFLLPTKTSNYDIENVASSIVKEKFDNIIENIILKPDAICFNLYKNKFIKCILESNYNSVSPLIIDNTKNIIVEFSSPNIAKPFHMGHLRSTIIGNFVSNINSFMGHNVKKINYLGDWGTQFGLIDIGTKLMKINDKEMEENPIKALYTSYVIANKQAETDPSVLDQAREIFLQLETGNAVTSEKWQKFRNYTTEELKRTYSRLNVTFDEYHWESMYRVENIKELITYMKEMKLLVKDEENRDVINLDEKSVAILKSDGTTLYIARDIAAAIDRFHKNEFDNMYYVVDQSQTEHFQNIIAILEKMKMPWSNRIKHIAFSKIHGLKTRKGNVIFLKDILDETRDYVREIQKITHTTKAALDSSDNSAEILGISAIIINDFQYKRNREYKFNWDVVTNIKGSQGIKLQYSHCRLVSLLENSGATLCSECQPSLLNHPAVDDLITIIGQFDEYVIKSYELLEPCILVQYLFNLSHIINKTWKALPVKGSRSEIASQRLLLFYIAKNILAQGMKILGLIPLNKM